MSGRKNVTVKHTCKQGRLCLPSLSPERFLIFGIALYSSSRWTFSWTGWCWFQIRLLLLPIVITRAYR